MIDYRTQNSSNQDFFTENLFAGIVCTVSRSNRHVVEERSYGEDMEAHLLDDRMHNDQGHQAGVVDDRRI